MTPVVAKNNSQNPKQEILPTKHVRPKKRSTRNPSGMSPPRDLSSKSKWKEVVLSGPADVVVDGNDVDKRVAKKQPEENVEIAEHTLDMLEMSLSGSLTSELGEFNDIPELRQMAEENRRERMRDGYSLERQLDEAIRRAEERERQELKIKEKEAQLAFEEVVRRYGASPANSNQPKTSGPVAISLDTVPTIPLSRPSTEKEDVTGQKLSHSDSKRSSRTSSSQSSRRSSQLQSPQVQFSQQPSPEKDLPEETKQEELQSSITLPDSHLNLLQASEVQPTAPSELPLPQSSQVSELPIPQSAQASELQLPQTSEVSEPQPSQPLQPQTSDPQPSQPLQPQLSDPQSPEPVSPPKSSLNPSVEGGPPVTTESTEPYLLFDLVDSDEIDSLMEPLSISSNLPISGPVTPLMATPLNGLASQLLGNPSSATRRAASALFSHPLPPEMGATHDLSVDLPLSEEDGGCNTEPPLKKVKSNPVHSLSDIIMVNCNVEIKAIHNCGSDMIGRMSDNSVVDRLQRCRKRIESGIFTSEQITEIEKKVDLILSLLMQDNNPASGSAKL